MLNNVMVDLETLGTRYDSVFTSVAAVQFDLETGETGKEFVMNVSIESALKAGLQVEAGTIEWWMKQDAAPRLKQFKNTHDLEKVLYELQFWFRGLRQNTLFDSSSLFPTSPVYVWGNSARFDLGMLGHGYRVMNMPPPWDEKGGERCYKTFAKMWPDISKDILDADTTEWHNPIHDCKRQIKVIVAIVNHINRHAKNLEGYGKKYGHALRLLYMVKGSNGHLPMEDTEKIIRFLENPTEYE